MRGLRIDEVVHQFQVGQGTVQVNALPPQLLNAVLEAVARLDDAGGFEDAADGGRVRSAENKSRSIFSFRGIPLNVPGRQEETHPGGVYAV